MPTVQRILETALTVTDLERSEKFYRDLFGFPTIFSVDRLRVLSIHDRQVLLLFLEGASKDGSDTASGFIPGHDGRGRMHFAFAIAPADIDPWRAKLKSLNIAVESETRGPRGAGHAIYFRDPDQHLVELATPDIWGFTTGPT